MMTQAEAEIQTHYLVDRFLSASKSFKKDPAFKEALLDFSTVVVHILYLNNCYIESRAQKEDEENRQKEIAAYKEKINGSERKT